MLARSLRALTAQRLHQPLARTLDSRLVSGTAPRLEKWLGSGLRCCLPSVLSSSTASHNLHTHYKSLHTTPCSDAWPYGLQKGALHRLDFNPRHGMILKKGNIHRTFQSTIGTSKTVMKQVGMPGKKTLKGPRTKQPSRVNLPAPEEASSLL